MPDNKKKGRGVKKGDGKGRPTKSDDPEAEGDDDEELERARRGMARS